MSVDILMIIFILVEHDTDNFYFELPKILSISSYM